MHMMKRRILRYAHHLNRLPTSVRELPPIEGHSNDTVDEWGREIQYEVENDRVTLTSYGRDGAPGGFGDDADIIKVFRTKDDRGNWNEELVNFDVGREFSFVREGGKPNRQQPRKPK